MRGWPLGIYKKNFTESIPLSDRKKKKFRQKAKGVRKNRYFEKPYIEDRFADCNSYRSFFCS